MISTKRQICGTGDDRPAKTQRRRPLSPLKDIAARQGHIKKYLEIIVRDMVSAGLIAAVSGKGGGYALCRRPEEYSVGEILEAMEGPLAPRRLPHPRGCPLPPGRGIRDAAHVGGIRPAYP